MPTPLLGFRLPLCALNTMSSTCAWELRLQGEPRSQRPSVIHLAPGRPTVVGADQKCTVVLGSPSFSKLISRTHAELLLDGDQPKLRDQSLNGCRVDGAIVNRCEVALQEGSEVEFGPRRDCPSIRGLANAADGHTPCGDCRPHARPRGEFVYRVHALRSNKRARQASVGQGSNPRPRPSPSPIAPALARTLALALALTRPAWTKARGRRQWRRRLLGSSRRRRRRS